ncbi:MAG: hypothetical protein MPW15_25990 [Candidatus Manganitrophus sp.]|nr:hypothetical protein [Candidatus Manganitrophus sp.]
MPKKDKKSAASAPARRKRNRPAVHRSGQNYRALLQNSPDVISNRGSPRHDLIYQPDIA